MKYRGSPHIYTATVALQVTSKLGENSKSGPPALIPYVLVIWMLLVYATICSDLNVDRLCGHCGKWINDRCAGMKTVTAKF